MILTHNEPVNLRSTLLSGQAFRWREHEGWFKGIISGNVIWIRETQGAIEFCGGPDNTDTLVKLLHNYFSLHTNIESIYRDLSFDLHIKKAINRHHGMRLLRQDPWECLVSFICSSASNIPFRVSGVPPDLEMTMARVVALEPVAAGSCCIVSKGASQRPGHADRRPTL